MLPLPELMSAATLATVLPVLPALALGGLAGLTVITQAPTPRLWRTLLVLCVLSVLSTVASAIATAPGQVGTPVGGLLRVSMVGAALAVLVQVLGTVIASFSQRYLQGEPGQRRYIGALAAVLAAVHLLLLADHWVVLLAAWAAVGVALQRLLCFYPERPFARLAAHKKRLADRAADVLLVAAAAVAWHEVGSGSLTVLWQVAAQTGPSGLPLALQASALLVVLAVVLRTALLPVHGWLIQVMEAPTPVSALLHAGVVNLGGWVLILFAPLLTHALPARAVLLAFGLCTAVLAGMVMLTRISIKVRLAWSTVAQMGFMLMECALGLYTLAALHLVGHSLYKAHAFLSASEAVRHTRLRALQRTAPPTGWRLVLAPVLAIAIAGGLPAALGLHAWPWWWSAVLGLAWAPLLWQPASPAGSPGMHALSASGPSAGALSRVAQGLAPLAMVSGLTALALLAHACPLGLTDAPQDGLGVIATLGMAALYLCLALLQSQASLLSGWRRWSYAGFYVDEAYTRLTLWLWPTAWAPRRPATVQLAPDTDAATTLPL